MIQNSIKESNCKYLFGKEANEIFKNIHCPKTINKKDFIEECLELSMRVHAYLFTYHEGILACDPRGFNKQCQLYGFRAAKINGTYHTKSELEKMAKTEENRFLHLAFFLNYAFRDTNNYVKSILSTMKKMEIEFQGQISKKYFIQFLRDVERCRETAARTAFNEVFEANLKQQLSQQQEEGPLKKELFLLSQEDLRINGSSLGVKIDKLYTYPKLAGLAYLVDAMARENMHFVFKVKVLTKNGYGGVLHETNGKINEADSVLTFGGFITDGSMSASECMEEAKKCPTYLYRHDLGKKRHSENTSCFYCKPIQIDLKPYQERLKRAMSSPQEMLYTLGAHFILQEQKPFLQYFQNGGKYPQLKNLFENSLPKIKELGLEDENKLLTLAIYHSYSESGKSALSNQFAFDSNPEAFLGKKGIIANSENKSVLEDFFKEKGFQNFSRSERKKIASTLSESILNEKEITIKSKAERLKKKESTT